MSNIKCNYSDESQIIISDSISNGELILRFHDLLWSEYTDSEYMKTFWDYIEFRLNIKLDLDGYPRIIVIQCASKEEALTFKLKYL